MLSRYLDLQHLFPFTYEKPASADGGVTGASGSAYLIEVASLVLLLRPRLRLGFIPAVTLYKTYIAAMSGAATSAGASKFQQFMNHPAGQLVLCF